MEEEYKVKSKEQSASEDRVDQNIQTINKTLQNIRQDIRRNNEENNRTLAGICAQLHIMQERLMRIESKSKNSIPGPPLKQYSRQKTSFETNEGDLPEEDNPTLSGSEGVHRLCLQEKIHTLVNDIDLKTTPLMDELIEDGCITQDEASNITERYDRKNQIRKLVYLLSRRSKSKFIKFLEKLQRSHNYPYIAKELSESFQNKIANETQTSECLICVIKRDVDLENVVEKLCQYSIVDMEFLNMIATRDNSMSHDQDNLWEAVFAKINQSSDKRQLIRKLQEALSVKYEHIAAKLNLYFAKQLTCYCGIVDQSKLLSTMFSAFPMSFAGSLGSLSDMSTTSESQRFVMSQLRKLSGAGVLQSPTVSSTTEEWIVDQHDDTRLPRTIQWLESIDNDGHSVTSTSDIDSMSFSSSFNRESFEKINEGNETLTAADFGDEDSKGKEQSTVSDHNKSDFDAVKRKTGNLKEEDFCFRGKSHDDASDLEILSTPASETSVSSKSFDDSHKIKDGGQNIYRFQNLDHSFSNTQKFINVDSKDFMFSKQEKMDEPATKKKKQLKKRTRTKSGKESEFNFVQQKLKNNENISDASNVLRMHGNGKFTSLEKADENCDKVNIQNNIVGLTKDMNAITLNNETVKLSSISVDIQEKEQSNMNLNVKTKRVEVDPT